MKTVEEIIAERRNVDNELFFVNLVYVSSQYGYDIVRRKKWYGVREGNNIVVSPLYDEVQLYPNGLVVLKIEGVCACHDIKSNQPVLGFEYLRIDYTDGFLKLYHQSLQRYGIFELANNRMLAECDRYEDYNLKDNSTEFLWAKRGKYYDYIERKTGRIFGLPTITMAYDTPTGMFGKDERDVVSVYSVAGFADRERLREIVQQEKGYLSLNNYTYHLTHIIDINGNVLNI